jgi:hypothetical protein
VGDIIQRRKRKAFNEKKKPNSSDFVGFQQLESSFFGVFLFCFEQISRRSGLLICICASPKKLGQWMGRYGKREGSKEG